MGLWNILESVRNQDISVMIIVNYNVIAVKDDRKGGCFLVYCKVHDFRSSIREAGLCDLEFSGAKYTWCHEQHGLARIWNWLDHAMCTVGWLDIFCHVVVCHLA